MKTFVLILSLRTTSTFLSLIRIKPIRCLKSLYALGNVENIRSKKRNLQGVFPNTCQSKQFKILCQRVLSTVFSGNSVVLQNLSLFQQT